MILVTGASGHIGNTLVRELLAHGEKVRGLVLPGENRTSLDGLDIEIVEGNVLDPQSLDMAFMDVHVVYHLAGIISIMSGKNERMWLVNVQGTRNVIEAAVQAGVKRMVHTSTIHAFKRPPDGVVMDESLPFDPHNPYGEYDRSKAAASIEVLNAVKQGLDAVIVCPTGVIGPYDYFRSEMGSMILEYLKARIHYVFDGSYDFVDVRDVAQGMILACEKGRTGEVYLLSGEDISLVRLQELVHESSQVKKVGRVRIPNIFIKGFAGIAELFYKLTKLQPRYTRYSIETIMGNSKISSAKAQQELGYRPRSLSVTISDTISWWKENHAGLIQTRRIR